MVQDYERPDSEGPPKPLHRAIQISLGTNMHPSEDTNAHLPIPASVAGGSSSGHEHVAKSHKGNL